jgi:hypothetical protein
MRFTKEVVLDKPIDQVRVLADGRTKLVCASEIELVGLLGLGRKVLAFIDNAAL